jgi:hypothetical protein
VIRQTLFPRELKVPGVIRIPRTGRGNFTGSAGGWMKILPKKKKTTIHQMTNLMKTKEASPKKSKSVSPKTLDFDLRGGSSGENFDDMEKLLAQNLTSYLAATDTALPQDVDVAAISIGISRVYTASQAGAQNVFLRNLDALTFIINIQASQALINTGRRFNANYQIIEHSTNTVKRNVWTNNSAFSWGTHFWISQGNNWGPNASNYTTPAKWGFAEGIYMFRATVEIIGLSAFAHSTEHYFRIR